MNKKSQSDETDVPEFPTLYIAFHHRGAACY